MEQQRLTDCKVSTTSGQLLGSRQTSCQGVDYIAFKGIPYAEPPIGPLRFRDPVPVGTWTGEREALHHGPACAQIRNSSEIFGSEDCLYLNVYTRCLDASERMPVMFWIHGGAFTHGSGDDTEFGPDYFLAKRVVLVTINYRLGIFGFLNLEDEEVNGNQGFKDMVTALKWVRDNINNFGGDPDNVTIFGGSTGGASVHYLSLSPMSRGLFHKAICQSGTALNPFSTKSNPLDSLYQYLDLLGFKDREPKTIVQYLRSVDYKTLVTTQNKLITHENLLAMLLPFGPAVDDKSANPFLPIPVALAVEEGVQLPLMIGYNSMEGVLFYRALKAIGFHKLNNHLEELMSYSALSQQLQPYSASFSDLKQLYLNSETIGEHNLHKVIDLIGDLAFVEPVHKLVKIQFHNSAAPTYLYKFSFRKNLTLMKKSLDVDFDGALHGDEIPYLFKSKEYEKANLEQLQPNTGADKVMKRMIELWVNFAQTGRPTPVKSELVPYYWQPLASHVVLRYLNIDEELRMEKMLNIEQRYSFKKTSRHVY